MAASLLLLVILCALLLLTATSTVRAADDEEHDEFALDTDGDDVESAKEVPPQETVVDSAIEDEFEEFDEFEGGVPVEEARPETEAERQAAERQREMQAARERQAAARSGPGAWALESVCVALVCAFAGVWWFGSQGNRRIAGNWAVATDSVWTRHFSMFARAAGDTTYSKWALLEENACMFSARATGKRGVVGCRATLLLRKRHDLYSLIVDTMYETPDRVVLEVQLDEMPPLVFGVVQRKGEKAHRKRFDDIIMYAKACEVAGLPESLAAYAQVGAESLLPRNVVDTLAKHAEHVLSVHITDQYSEAVDAPMVCRFEFSLSQSAADHELLECAFRLVDCVRQYSLPSGAVATAVRMRADVQAQQEKKKREANEGDLQDKLRKKKLEDPVLRKKLEEKEARKRKKMMQPRMKIIK